MMCKISKAISPSPVLCVCACGRTEPACINFTSNQLIANWFWFVQRKRAWKRTKYTVRENESELQNDWFRIRIDLRTTITCSTIAFEMERIQRLWNVAFDVHFWVNMTNTEFPHLYNLQFDCVKELETWQKINTAHSLVILSNQMRKSNGLNVCFVRLLLFSLVFAISVTRKTIRMSFIVCHSCNLPFDDVNANALIFSNCWLVGVGREGGCVRARGWDLFAWNEWHLDMLVSVTALNLQWLAADLAYTSAAH